MEKRQLNLNAPLLSARRYSLPMKSSGEVVDREVIEKQIQNPRKSYNASQCGSDVVLKPAAAAGGIPFHWEQSPGRPKDAILSPAGSKLDAFRRYHSGEVHRLPPCYRSREVPWLPTAYRSGEVPRIHPGRASYYSSEIPRIPPGRVSYYSGEVPRIPPGRASYYSGEVPRIPPGRASYYSGEVPRLLPPARFSSGERINDKSIYKPHVEAFSITDHANLLQKLNESLNCEEGSGSESGHDTYSDALEMLSPGESEDNNSSADVNSNQSRVDTQTRDLMMNRFLRAAKAAVVETPGYAVKKCTVVNELPKPVKKVLSRETPKPNASHSYNQHASEVESEDDQECKNTVKSSGKAWGFLPRFCVNNALRLLNPLPGIKSRIRAASAPPAVSVNSFTRNARSGPLDKSGCPVPVAQTQRRRFYSGFLSRDLLRNDNKPTGEFGLSPLRRYRSGNGNSSPYRGFSGPLENSNANKIASSRKLFHALHNVSRNHGIVEAVEKTVYIDKSSFKKNEVAAMRMEDKLDPCLKTTTLEATELQDFCFILDAKQTHSPDANKTASPKAGSKVKPRESANRPGTMKRDDQKPNSDSRKQAKSTTPVALAPPLPNSPSESWLWKTLPSIPQSKISIQKARSIDAKWEAVVKTSTNSGQLRPYSQELIPRSTHGHRKS